MIHKNHLFKIALILVISSPFQGLAQNLSTPFEQDDNQSSSYHDVIDYYQRLAAWHPDQVQLTSHGSTDVGFPLHTVVIDLDGDFDPVSAKAKGKVIVFVNNAIHPGEPCGIDASMMFGRDLLNGKLDRSLLEKVTLVVVPVYNIGGSLNRGAFSRANQNGPAAYGFRGNARNLDLNRDWVKADSRNAKTMNKIFGYWKPHIFIDNHTSNGADYQYSITLIATQHNKLQTDLAQLMNQQMLPFLYNAMLERDWEMTPYVYARSTPDKGIAGFLDLPRYSSGYAALHNAISFMPETHMLKPFKNRVWSVYHFMDAMLHFVQDNHQLVLDTKAKADQATQAQSSFDLNWSLDQSRADTIQFKGYTPKYKPSLISGKDRLYYDRAAPFTTSIPHYNYYQSTLSVEKPAAYYIPQAYQDVIDRLRWNGVELQRLEKDTPLEMDFYYIKDYKSRTSPYEGHYLHYNVEAEQKTLKIEALKGDYIVYANQASNQYILHTLEPQAPDAFFAWNFFDGILMQKEHFSSYVFEDLAYSYLEENPALKAKLETKKEEDEQFAGSARAQLNFIYEHSPYYEPTYRRYPIARLSKEQIKVID